MSQTISASDGRHFQRTGRGSGVASKNCRQVRLALLFAFASANPSCGLLRGQNANKYTRRVGHGQDKAQNQMVQASVTAEFGTSRAAFKCCHELGEQSRGRNLVQDYLYICCMLNMSIFHFY